MKALSRKYSGIGESLTLSITAKAKNLKAKGENIVSFGAGEPDFRTPEKIRKEAIAKIETANIGYTQVGGMEELKLAICRKLERDNGLFYEPSQIVVSNGAKHSLSNALLAVCNPDDEVLLPSPYWVSYYELIKMAGGIPVLVEGSKDNDFKVTPSDLFPHLNENTKAIILNSPSNPTGAVYTKEELMALGTFCTDHDLYIISDEIYEKIMYGQTHHSIASFSEDLYERTIVVNGLSKSYAMTGWRMGYTASSKRIAKLMTNIQSHETSNPCTISQYASIVALDECEDDVQKMRSSFAERLSLLLSLLEEIPGITFVKPSGAFYIMVNVSAIYDDEIKNSLEFADRLLEEEKVAVVPGIAFGADEYIRMSFATSKEQIIDGMHRFKLFMERRISK